MSRPIGYNITEKGKAAPARRRFTDPQAVYDVYDKLKIEDAQDAIRRTKIRNAVEGGLPYSKEQLRSKGLAYMTNLNFQSLKGLFDSRADSIMRLGTDTCNLVELVPSTDGSAGPDADRIAEIVAEEYSMALRREGHTIPAIAMMRHEADLYGIGPITFPNDEAYAPMALERGQLRFRGDGPSMSSDHDLFMFESELPASYLFSLLDSEDVAAETGWDIEVLKKFIIDAFDRDQNTANDSRSIDGLSPMESSLLRLKNNTFYERHQFDSAKVLHVYVREMAYPRGITHVIVPGRNMQTKKFLYYRTNAYETMDQCMLWLPYTVNDRFARSVRGLATTLVPIERTSDRLTCALIDSAFRAARLTLQQTSPGANPAVSLSESGNATIVAAGLEPVPNANAAANLQALMTVRQFMAQVGTGAVSGADYAPVSTGVKVMSGGDAVSKAEAEIQERRRLQKDENLFNSCVIVHDKIFSESFRRFMKIVNGAGPAIDDYPEVKQFVENCMMRGVTREMLKDIPGRFTVMTCRELMLGADGKYQILAQMLQLTAGNIDEAGRKAATHDMYRLRLGRKDADRYCPLSSRDKTPSDQASHAVQENNAIRRLEPALVGQDQWHWAHIPVHAQVLQEVQQAVQQGLAEAQGRLANGGKVEQSPDGELAPVVDDPERMMNVLEAASTHIQEHLALGQNELGQKQAAEQVRTMLKDLAPTIKALNLAIATQRRVVEAEEEKRQRELEEAQQAASAAEMQKAMAKVQADKEVGMAKVQAEKEIGMAKVQADRELNTGKLQNDREQRAGQLGLETESARARAANEAAVARAGIENRRAESEASIENGRRQQAAQEDIDLRRQQAESMAMSMRTSERNGNITGRNPVSPGQVAAGNTPPAEFNEGTLPL